MNNEEIIETIGNMTVLQLSELVKQMEDKFGVSASAPAMAMPMMAGGAAPAVEEQTEFDVILKSSGSNKIAVIKAVRELTALGLKEAKAVVDGAPGAVKEKLSKEDAAKYKEALVAAGAEVEIK